MSCQTPCCCTESFEDVTKIVAPKSLDELLKQLEKIFSKDRVNVEYVTALMKAYKSNPEDWKKYAMMDQHKYTRNLVSNGNGKFNLLVLCWNMSQGSSIHAHANSHCFMKILDGEVLEERFDWPTDSDSEASMSKTMERKHTKDTCAYIHDKIGLHRVSNPSHAEPAITLHLYSPPFSEVKCFDEQTSHVTMGQMALWSINGVKSE
ncbi:cysteine dioxygenase type 1-like [Gigantopelta aegis]|uniref:cysteine dioxygenase type 1-like n=1 Tax=Gigantopelta aegis TaxID=1735272 RepID=UPI001B889578|nr:cysteine dioxygenase type 1-like [Gigantopelta aegis]